MMEYAECSEWSLKVSRQPKNTQYLAVEVMSIDNFTLMYNYCHVWHWLTLLVALCLTK